MGRINKQRDAKLSKSKSFKETDGNPAPYKVDRKVISGKRETEVFKTFGWVKSRLQWVLKLECGHTAYMTVTARSPYYDKQPEMCGCHVCKQEKLWTRASDTETAGYTT